MYRQIYDARRLTSDLCSLTSSSQAGSSTVREHSADIRETVVRLHLGLLATSRREKTRPLRLRRVRTNERREVVLAKTGRAEPPHVLIDGSIDVREIRMLLHRRKRTRPRIEVVV